jgi:hypothetical protein
VAPTVARYQPRVSHADPPKTPSEVLSESVLVPIGSRYHSAIASFTGEGVVVDRYTKVVLTVIAVALVILTAQNAMRSSQAQSFAPQKVQICDALGHCATLTKHTTMVGGTPASVGADGKLSFGTPGTPLDSYSLDVTPAQQ